MHTQSSIQLLVRQAAYGLEHKIDVCHHILEELRRMSLILFQCTKAPPPIIQNWFKDKEFGVDPDGFWLPLPQLRAFRNHTAEDDIISYSWHPALASDEEASFRLYCLRNTGPYLKEIRQRLPGAAWIYYQDVTNTSIQFPYIDQSKAIYPDFDWSTYHTYVSVSPENNPERCIQWTRPSIDYAGEGLIISASIPVYMADRFIGLWSLDLPVDNIYMDTMPALHYRGQINFIIDREGYLIAHPSLPPRIDRKKGSLFRHHLHELGDHFKPLSPEKLLRTQSGHFLLENGDGDETVGWFHTVHGIQWTVLTTLPRQAMEDAVNRKIRVAVDHIKSGNLSHRISDDSDIDHARKLVEGFNQMMDTLEHQENQRRKNQKLEKRIQHFQRMEAIGTLAGGIAHDFNNILFPILGYSELLRHDLAQDSQAFHMVDQIHKGALRARELTGQILTFSRKTELEDQIVSFGSIVKEALKLLRASIPKTIDILQNISPDCPPVIGDPTRLHQIIMNLSTNAFHAVESTGGRFEVTMTSVTVHTPKEVQNLEPGLYVRLTVSDDGCGMSPQTLEQIFDPYFTTKVEGKGTGLGLSITYGIVHQLSGTIKAYSELGKGSTFHVYLPAKRAETTTPPPDQPSAIQGNEHILLVDDETSITELGKTFFEKHGYMVTTYTDSQAALEAFSRDPDEFDVVITDMTMPRLTGDELARKMKGINPGLPIILCSGFSEKLSMYDSTPSAIDRFFMKPVSFYDITKAIRELVPTRKPQKNI